MRKLLSVFLVFFFSFVVHAQKQPISEKEKNSAIDSISHTLKKYYVLPDRGKVMAAYLEKQNKKKAYKKLTDYNSFIEQLNKDIQSAHKDLHLKLSYSPEKAKLIKKVEQAKPDSSFFIRRDAVQKYFNYGIGEVKRLEGNINYIDLRQFANVNKQSLQTIHAALTLNPNPNAFIIDLRENGGGTIDMSRHIISYFLKDSTHLSNLVNRITGKTDVYWTLPHKKPNKFYSTPIYILTSANTFSAAEEFAYSLKNLKRAIIIGEKTAGGAHGFGSKVINNSIVISIPFERIENAVTKDNWEGIGISPDVAIASFKALDQAHLIALENLKTITDDADALQEVKWKKENLSAVIKSVKLNDQILKKYTGSIGARSFQILNGELYLQRGDKATFRMIPLNENTFFIKELNYRLQFSEEKDGKLSLHIIFPDEYRQKL